MPARRSTALRAAMMVMVLSGRPDLIRAQAGKCLTQKSPSTLPAVDAILDSAALVTALAPYDSAFDMRIAVHRVAGLTFFRIGSGREASAEPQPDLFRSVARPGAAFEGVSVVIHARREGAIALRMERSTVCAPTADPASTQNVPGVRVVTGNSSWSRQKLVVPPMRVLVGADGGVRDVQLQGSSGAPDFDSELIRITRQTRYRPATLDGRAVSAWLLGKNVVEVIP